MHRFVRALGALVRALAHAVFFVFIVIVALFPLPVMPIVMALQKRRTREVATQVDRKR